MISLKGSRTTKCLKQVKHRSMLLDHSRSEVVQEKPVRLASQKDTSNDRSLAPKQSPRYGSLRGGPLEFG